jgi:L-ascorbate metabolism protein UlaG (beta-lactamase superfamily)
MNNLGVKIWYLYHSGFAVEVNDNFLIFDYYNDTPECAERNLSNGVISESELENKKNIFVFSSHGHHDHFNPIIFQWQNYCSNIKYILSSDIKIENPKDNYQIMEPYKTIKFDNIEVSSYGSTDIGVSYLIKLNGITIFHAGDLNWWYWDDDTDIEKALAENGFKSELEKIPDKQINIAFFPIDPRLGEFYSFGGEYFISKIKPDYFIPMHFGDSFNITKSFSEKFGNLPTKIMKIEDRGQIILI